MLTARQLGHGAIKEEELDEGERRALKAERSPLNRSKLPYLNPGYFGAIRQGPGDVYYGSLDLQKFYPSISVGTVLQQFIKYSDEVRSDTRIAQLVERMLNFSVSTHGLSPKMRVCEPRTPSGRFNGVPTGLMVAGFLSNVAMLSVDKQVNQEIPYKGIAHFRFVDDHTFLAPDFDVLLDWMARYNVILRNHLDGVYVNDEKYQPEELKALLTRKGRKSGRAIEKLRESAKSACKVDPVYPRPLLTRTLAQLSLLGSIDFDTLDDEGQHGQIEQIITLMLTALPDTELREDTRKTYAAARLTALVPKLRENVDQWASKARDLNNVREKKRSLEERKRILQSGTAAASELTAIDTALALLHAHETELEKESLAAQQKLLKERQFSHRRAFELLFEAFCEHPYKGRLLELLFRFCSSTGYPGLGAIFKKIGELQQESYQLGTYLRASSFHALGYLIARAALGLVDIHSSERRREASKIFLTSVAALGRDTFRSDPEYFSQDALSFLGIGAATAAFTLEEYFTLHPADTALGAKLAQLTSDSEDISAKPAQRFKTIAKDKLASWLFWADGVSLPKGSTDPSPQWSSLVTSLDPKKKLDWNVLRRYPKQLPDSAIAYLQANGRYLDALDQGWLYDVLRARNDGTALPRRMARVRNAATQPIGRADLVAWAETARTIHSTDPFDPRASEWTALEILNQVLAAIETFQLGPRVSLCHPTNYTVPASWLKPPPDPWSRSSKIWTWESWKNFAREKQSLKARPSRSLITDYRYKEGADSKAEDALRAELIAYGLLLFGLLRRSFNWPSLWNIRGQERSHVWLAGMESQRLTISSETLAILDGLLRPRSWETVLLFETAPGFTGFSKAEDVTKGVVPDTALDVTPLTTPRQLRHAIATAQRALEAGQVAGFENRPRQLVPVNIRHLAATEIAGQPQDDED
ncbi:RNA-directed DNA polymerase [Pseudolabrys sp. FHR47]|uniref:RNA-directed DNA polymerase n=1 Tax=Pseudolabrys sp. FHR47 TaxID=2562284 RepID=UPI0010BEA12E|nr:RNA-directed DNA polymerase [Pseudolabrys sp. FHR47]